VKKLKEMPGQICYGPGKDQEAHMSTKPVIDDSLREKIIAEPDVILDDTDLMRALVAANERALGSNIVDLRGVAMERLETRLDRLEDTHRSVIAAAYENLAGTNQVHRAILRMLEPTSFEAFLRDLSGPVAEVLRVDCIKLVLETAQTDDDPVLKRLGGVLSVAHAGYIQDYLTDGRNIPQRQVTLRQVHEGDLQIYGEEAGFVRSEACMTLDFGPNRLPGMLVLGSEDPHQFSPQQGTDLLGFFAGVFERTMRRWLA
jgi:uncharacterized protein YigA (DUF484 family)